MLRGVTEVSYKKFALGYSAVDSKGTLFNIQTQTPRGTHYSHSQSEKLKARRTDQIISNAQEQ